MFRLCVPFALLAASALSLLVAQDRDKSRRDYNQGVTMTVNDEAPSCQNAVKLHSGRYDSVHRAEETRSFPNQPMKVTSARNSGIHVGIHVRTAARSDIAVTICKIAAGESDAHARSIADLIHLKASGNTLTIDGPASSGEWNDSPIWGALMLIEAPAGATFDLFSHSGGISAREFTGNLTAETINGGISLVKSTGKFNLDALNGGIAIKDCGGDVKARVQNGGVSLELAQVWEGAGLEAHTQNGGLAVSVPREMRSGVELGMSRHSGVVCQADICGAGQRTWDDNGRVIRFGSGHVVVRASTVNGGVVIRERWRRTGKL